MVYMLTFTINIPQMLAYLPYMDPMGHSINDVFPIISSFPTFRRLGNGSLVLIDTTKIKQKGIHLYIYIYIDIRKKHNNAVRIYIYILLSLLL